MCVKAKNKKGRKENIDYLVVFTLEFNVTANRVFHYLF